METKTAINDKLNLVQTKPQCLTRASFFTDRVQMFKTSQKVSKTDPFVRTTNIDILPGACVYDRNVHCIMCMLSYLLNRSSTQHIQYGRPSIEKNHPLCSFAPRSISVQRQTSRAELKLPLDLVL